MDLGQSCSTIFRLRGIWAIPIKAKVQPFCEVKKKDCGDDELLAKFKRKEVRGKNFLSQISFSYNLQIFLVCSQVSIFRAKQ